MVLEVNEVGRKPGETARSSVNVRHSADEASTRQDRHYGVVERRAGRRKNTKEKSARACAAARCSNALRSCVTRSEFSGSKSIEKEAD